MEKEIYDYGKAIDAPYWIQQVWVGKKGKRKLLWTFTVPMQLSYFVVFLGVLSIMILYLGPIMDFLYKWTFATSVLLYWYLPQTLARLYVESEPQGKKMHQFLIDYLRYLITYRMNRKAIYHNERVDTYDTFVFEKTKL